MTRLEIVPYANQAWRWASNRAAVLLALLLSIQGSLRDSAGDFALFTQSPAWSYGTAALAATIIVLRLIHEPPPPGARPYPGEAPVVYPFKPPDEPAVAIDAPPPPPIVKPIARPGLPARATDPNMIPPP